VIISNHRANSLPHLEVLRNRRFPPPQLLSTPSCLPTGKTKESAPGQERRCGSRSVVSGLPRQADLLAARPDFASGANRRLESKAHRGQCFIMERCRSPREVVGPKVDCDGRQAQSYADPEDRRMMDRSSVARSWLHSITSSARASSEGGTARPSAFTVLRLITNSSTPIAEGPSPRLLDQLGAKTSVLGVGY
jgi:hypothetical protein